MAKYDIRQVNGKFEVVTYGRDSVTIWSVWDTKIEAEDCIRVYEGPEGTEARYKLQCR